MMPAPTDDMAVVVEPTSLRLVDPEEQSPQEAQDEFLAEAPAFQEMKKVRCPRAPYDFEGKEIETTSVKLQTGGVLEVDDRILKVDDIVEMKVVGRVSGLAFPADKKSGRLSRVHVVTVFEAEYVRGYAPAGGVEFE